jgi:hypothetical protein
VWSRDGTRPRRRVPLVLLPWLVYVGATVVVPAANGAAGGPAFTEHAIITLGVSGAVLMLWLAASRLRPERSGLEPHAPAPPLHQHHVAPAAEVASDPLARTEHAEATGLVQRKAGRVLGEDPGLERPQAGLLRGAAHGLEQSATDAAPARGRGHVHAHLGDTCVDRAARDGG